jgi:hypothetical protein
MVKSIKRQSGRRRLSRCARAAIASTASPIRTTNSAQGDVGSFGSARDDDRCQLDRDLAYTCHAWEAWGQTAKGA